MNGDPFRGELMTFPDQLRREPGLPGGGLDGRRVVLYGMGGSALAAEFAARRLSARPAETRRDEILGDDVGSDDVLILVSCSGNTAETLRVWRAAAERGIRRGAVASGGALLAAARAEGMPWVEVPGGLSPRSSIGYLIRAVLALAGEPGTPESWRAAADHVEAVRDRWSTHAPGEDGLESGPAAELAWKLHGRLPALIAPDRHLAPAARRWAADLAENAKCPSLVWELPEAAHNAVMTLAREAPRRLPLVPLVIGAPRSPEAVRRWEALRWLIEGGGTTPVDVLEPHPDPWIEALGLVAVSGWVSTLMAEIEGIAAGSLSLMNDLKRLLAEEKGPGT